MLRVLRNQYGFGVNLVMATVLVVVTISSMVSMVRLVSEDRNTVNWVRDRLQQELLLRSEVKRINYILDRDLLILPRRQIEIVGSDRVATYTINHRRSTATATSISGVLSETSKVEAMCISKPSRRYINSPTGKNSPVLSFIEKQSRRASLAQYQYFSDTERSDISDDPNNTASIVRFDGRDVLWGRVHSNDNIYLMSGNGGWPTFHAEVTTAKEIREWSGGGWMSWNHSRDSYVFPGGLQEHMSPILYEPDASIIKSKGLRPYGFVDSPYEVFYCNIMGNYLQMRTASVTTRIDTFVVYNSYPDPVPGHYQTWDGNGNATEPYRGFIGDSLWTNYIAMPDTLWDVQPNIILHNNSVYLPGQVWIKGTVSGKMTVASKKDTYILGHIQYHGTPLGTRPDDPEGLVNTSDYFGLVSEGKIFLKYKYIHPDSATVVFKPNATGADGHLYIYGALSAQGVADPELGAWAYKTEGTFTYEYQHPHGAMPNSGRFPIVFKKTRNMGVNEPPVPLNLSSSAPDTLLTHFAFHRFKFPPDAPTAVDRFTPVGVGGGYPDLSALPWNKWPGFSTVAQNGYPAENLDRHPWYQMYDYPWHNPIGPEPDRGAIFVATPANPRGLVYQRGTLHVYGAIAQRRRGFMNRSGTIRADNPDVQNYWDVDNYVFGGQHSSTGYEKDYHYDQRFYYVQPPHYPEVYQDSVAGRLSSFEETAWNYRVPPRNWIY